MARAGKVAVRRMIKLLLFILCSYDYCFSFVEKGYMGSRSVRDGF